MSALSLAQASEIVDAALEKGRELGLQPLAVTLLDTGGNHLVFKREDNGGLMRPGLSYAKAWGAVGLGVGGGRTSRHAKDNPNFFAALAAISDGRVASSRGGVLIRDSDGELLGAIGVSGDRPENAEAVAVFAVEKAGLVADAG